MNRKIAEPKLLLRNVRRDVVLNLETAEVGLLARRLVAEHLAERRRCLAGGRGRAVGRRSVAVTSEVEVCGDHRRPQDNVLRSAGEAFAAGAANVLVCRWVPKPVNVFDLHVVCLCFPPFFAVLSFVFVLLVA